jgi:hypothetical protein
MSHTVESANGMIKIAAFVVGGVYMFRRFTEATAEQEKASTSLTPLGQFVIAWGTVFLTLSIIAPAAPTLAGNMALLLMIASLLANGIQVSKDLSAGMNRSVRERNLAVAMRRGRKPPGIRGPVGKESSAREAGEPLTEVGSV